MPCWCLLCGLVWVGLNWLLVCYCVGVWIMNCLMLIVRFNSRATRVIFYAVLLL